jgi:hypothetical protein
MVHKVVGVCVPVHYEQLVTPRLSAPRLSRSVRGPLGGGPLNPTPYE